MFAHQNLFQFFTFEQKSLVYKLNFDEYFNYLFNFFQLSTYFNYLEYTFFDIPFSFLLIITKQWISFNHFKDPRENKSGLNA